ncbi:MAG TPA: PTS sugar transporter subunit IIA [Pseudolabrys sp.]
MTLSDFLSPSNVLLQKRAADSRQLLHDLSQRAAACLGLDEAAIVAALLKREALGSTGMGNGVAIPHARLAPVKKPFGLLARLDQPIDFDAIDGRPVDLVFVLLLPATGEGEQLGALALVARRLRMPEVLERLRRARNTLELHEVVCG